MGRHTPLAGLPHSMFRSLPPSTVQSPFVAAFRRRHCHCCSSIWCPIWILVHVRLSLSAPRFALCSRPPLLPSCSSRLVSLVLINRIARAAGMTFAFAHDLTSHDRKLTIYDRIRRGSRKRKASAPATHSAAVGYESAIGYVCSASVSTSLTLCLMFQGNEYKKQSGILVHRLLLVSAVECGNECMSEASGLFPAEGSATLRQSECLDAKASKGTFD